MSDEKRINDGGTKMNIPEKWCDTCGHDHGEPCFYWSTCRNENNIMTEWAPKLVLNDEKGDKFTNHIHDNGGPAFPRTQWTGGSQNKSYRDVAGMPLCDYACIKLKIPKTDKNWLNEIIIESQRNEIAAKAMQKIISEGGSHSKEQSEIIARYSYKMADAMNKESKK